MTYAAVQKHPRFKVSVPVDVLDPDGRLHALRLDDVSLGGVFIATYRALPIGSEVDIQLELPTGSLHATGVVRWHRTVDACEDWPGMGVQFSELTEDAKARVREFIDVRDPLFFGD